MIPTKKDPENDMHYSALSQKTIHLNRLWEKSIVIVE